MSLLTKVTKKAYHGMKVSDSKGVFHDVKILADQEISSRTGRIDRRVVVDVDTAIIPGTELLLYGDKYAIVSYVQPDYYSGKVIRYLVDCVDATHTVDIKRAAFRNSGQGGLVAKDDTVVCTAIPAKVGLSSITESKTIDYSQPKYALFLSVMHEVAVGDRVELSGTVLEAAKINSLSHATPGLLEVRFDIDPRWL